MTLQHILEVRQFDRELLDQLFDRATARRQEVEAGGSQRLHGRILATLFYEPSTRTRLSFESAMLRLGGQILSSEMAGETSSAAKGETIEDTIRIVESYADAIVMRHPEAGSADAAAAVASVPILNAGDGAREHPTQALLDVYTLQREFGRIDDLTVALVGDLRYGRAPRSLALLLARATSCRLILVAPPQIDMGPDILDELDSAGTEYRVERELDAALSDADAVYMTRVQKERFSDPAEYESARGSYRFTTGHLQQMRQDAVLLHPLPRVDEIEPDVDRDPRAAYFRQAQNGVHIRMALLDLLLNPPGTVV